MAQRGKRIRKDVRERAEELAAAGEQPSAIVEKLADEFGPSDAPLRRTVQSIVSATKARPSEPWDYLEADPADAALVLPVYRALVDWLGRPIQLTVRQVERLVHIRRSAEDIPLLEAGRLSLPVEPSMGLTDFLAWAPWRGEADQNGHTENGRAYTEAFNARRITTWRANQWSPSSIEGANP